ncbi:MAG: HipA N-terminal domain-containing protein [Bacteroidales bacterium]|nr:HipA N-terminal domain-containing protein [Bacteroidales bacterium]
MRRLLVYMNGCRAGVLTELRPGRGYTFQYDDDYLASDNPPVSVTMPKREESFESEYLFPFFVNMLPEGANRRVVCRSLKIDEDDYFGMLDAMAGNEFIGAVHIKPYAG